VLILTAEHPPAHRMECVGCRLHWPPPRQVRSHMLSRIVMPCRLTADSLSQSLWSAAMHDLSICCNISR
jgi:hypothetical protein